MDSLVKQRPNHYELLGLTPAATDDDIARAFAREISPLTPHAFGDIALLSVAHETLRDPVKRRAYDDSLGLNRKPPAPKPLQGWQYSTTVSLAPPARPAPPPPLKTEPRAEEEEQPPASQPVAPASESRRDWIPPRPIPLHIRPFEEDASEWKRPVIIGGGIFLGVAIMGVLAGLWAARDVQSKIPAEALQIEAPAEAHPAPVEPSSQAVEAAAQPLLTSPPPRTRPKPPRAKPVQAQEQRAEDVPEIPTEQVAALASQASEADDASAAMPLSNAVIARTIGRIGYSCGDVASTSAVDGSPGVFKVTCTSGQTYRAAPVRGRYHFRRWAG
jgi:curved DNA-binding protein CbpA